MSTPSEPEAARARVDEMLSSGDPWALMDAMADTWSEALAEAADARFATGTAEQRKRLVWLLGRVREPEAAAVLSGWLPGTDGDEAGTILAAMNARKRPVPSHEIRRLLASAPEAAVVAAGLSGDTSLAGEVEARLKEPRLSRHAALALALLGRRESAEAIAARMTTADVLDVAGFAVALEVMHNTRVVPILRGLLDAPGTRGKWEIHHALCRLCDREPLVPLDGGDDAMAAAWRTLDLDAPRAPQLTVESVADDARAASFTLHDGAGAVRIDYLPPTPGSTWPRWSLGLYVGEQPLYHVGSRCGTCETTLHLLGLTTERVAARADHVRRTVADVPRLDPGLFSALAPYLALLRTGHYQVHLCDLDLEPVETPEASWFTRRHRHRTSDETPEPEGPAEWDIAWPGIVHFQTRRGPCGTTPTYGVVLPSQPLANLDEATIAYHAARIALGERPTALVVGWVEDKHVRAEFPERFLNMLVLDGHHKLAAYARSETPARCLVLCRLEDSWGPPGDRGKVMREAVDDLVAAQPSS